MRWFAPTGAWHGSRWYGPEQVEDRSRENVKRCFDFLLSRPYLSTTERERLEELRFVQMLKTK